MASTKPIKYNPAFLTQDELIKSFVVRNADLELIMDFADEQDKRLLFIVENLHMLLGQQIAQDAAWEIRHTLINEPRLMLLGNATNRFEQLENSGKAMFELFKIHELEPLSSDDCRNLWSSITGQELKGDRIRPIQILTGGSPRLLVIISVFAAKASFSNPGHSSHLHIRFIAGKIVRIHR